VKKFIVFFLENIKIGFITFVISLGVLSLVCIYSNYKVDELRNEYVPTERAGIIKEKVEILERQIEQLEEQKEVLVSLKEKGEGNLIGKKFTLSIKLSSDLNGYSKKIYNTLWAAYINDYKWMLNYDKLADETGMPVEKVKNCIWNENTSQDEIEAETVIIFNIVAYEEQYMGLEKEFLSWIEEENERLSENIMAHDIEVLNIQNVDAEDLVEQVLDAEIQTVDNEISNCVYTIAATQRDLAADELRFVNGEEPDYFWDEGHFYRMAVAIAVFISILVLLIRYVTEDEKCTKVDL